METKFRTLTWLAVLSMLVALAACSRPPAPTLTPVPAGVALAPFTSPELGLRGVAPEAWVEVMPGEFYRGMPDDDLAILQHQFIVDIPLEQIKTAFVSQQGLKEFPKRAGRIQTLHFTWDVYTVEVSQPIIGKATLDIALAETDAGVYAVALATRSSEHAALHEAVFLPAVQALAPAVITEQAPAGETAQPLPERDYWPTDGWRTSAPEAQGIDSRRLAQMWAYIQQKHVRIDSVTIIRHGYLVWDAYARWNGRDTKYDLHSCTKSFTSALVGIAIDQGYIKSLDQPVLSFFPGRSVANLDARKQAMTLEHLLTMRDGLDWGENSIGVDPAPTGDELLRMKQAGDWVQFVLDRPMAAEPGTRWNYNTGASHLLSAILQEATGQTALEFASEHLFGPLGISSMTWETDPQGRNSGGTSLRLTTGDMAKFGYLYLNEGRWNGQQIVPAAWVRDSTTSRYPTFETYYGNLAYGYQWWIIPWAGYYSAIGAHGQYIFVLPKQDMVVVFTSNLADADMFTPPLLLAFYIQPGLLK